MKVIERYLQEIEDRGLTGDSIVSNTGCFASAAAGPSPSYTRGRQVRQPDAGGGGEIVETAF
jgi:hypothetical protein